MEQNFLLRTINDMVTNTGSTVYDLSYAQPVLLVFLRRFGCVFCRESMDVLGEKRKEIEASGTRIVLVQMGDQEKAEKNWKTFNLEGISNVCDPTARFYKAFGLVRGNYRQLYGLTMWIDGVSRKAFKKYGGVSQIGDGFQMPGAFMLYNGVIHDSFIHKSVSDQPDYDKMMDCCTI